jgi:uncharacterized protein YjbJ (UPF0337 family)
MKNSTKNEIEGKLHELKGNLKKKAGEMTNNPRLEAEGRIETLGGKVQQKLGQVKKVFGK